MVCFFQYHVAGRERLWCVFAPHLRLAGSSFPSRKPVNLYERAFIKQLVVAGERESCNAWPLNAYAAAELCRGALNVLEQV